MEFASLLSIPGPESKIEILSSRISTLQKQLHEIKR